MRKKIIEDIHPFTHCWRCSAVLDFNRIIDPNRDLEALCKDCEKELDKMTGDEELAERKRYMKLREK